ncbi:MAG: hypothetical protein HYU52_09995 [Acidobacteria bacterium]|nr:hypothetical protein [Acidobacteriota bacterium]
MIDVRAEDPHALEAIEWFLEGIGPLTDTQIQGIPKRSVLHSGWAPQVGSSSGGYYSAFVTRPASPVEPATNGRRAPRIVFVARASVPETAAALAASSKAGLISELTLGDDAVGETFSIDAGGGWTASVRTSEAAISGITADAVVAPGRNDSTLAYAVVLARGDAPFAPRTTVARNDLPRRLRDDPYVESPYPELPVRLLALFRFWSVIDWFYPYKDLIGDWDAVLRESIACFEEAADANEYTTAVFRLVASVPDGHSGASGNPALKLFGGTAQIPIEVRAVEGEYVVTAKGYAEGIAIGDVVLAIDGEDLRARVERMRPLFAASTEVARVNRLLALSRRGANDTVARVTVRRTDGSAVTVEVPRVPGYVPRISSGEPWRILEGNVGYVDLTRLTIDRVPAMFDAIMTTRATIFDVRGYPRGTIWAMAPRLNTKRAKTAAQFRRRMISPASLDERESSYEFEQHLPAGDTPLPIYQGRTIALIDDRAISHAEHTCLFLEAANGTTFVGTNTAGANGDITNVVLPGGFTAYFTGHDVRHADGRQLQRVGIVPDIVAAPTLAGLRAGRDEVLERALGLLN